MNIACRSGDTRRHLLGGLVLVACLAAPARAEVAEDINSAIARIRDEGTSRSQVMQTAGYLTDVHGARLTASPQFREAAEWAVAQLETWGIANAQVEEWGRFGTAWQNERYAAHVLTPHPWPIAGLPKAFTPGTNGPVVARAVYAPLRSESDFEAWKGKLKGHIVLPVPARELAPLFDPPARRFSGAELEHIARKGPPAPPQRGGEIAFSRQRLRFLIEQEAAAVLEPTRGDTGALFVQQGGAFDPDRPPDSPSVAWPRHVPPQVVTSAEHYGRIARLIGRGQMVTIELDIRNRSVENQPGLNLIAELPGTDKADEVVMLGAHLDSWHGATGATDNAVGAAVMLEAMRILKTTGVPLRRTVRLALWSGEEQGLLGSRAYVARHFADRETMERKPGHGKISAYFNLDNGTGAIRGVYLQGNQAAGPIFGEWMKTFTKSGVTTLSNAGTLSSDHVSFDEVGIPAFQFIQDPMEYRTRTHHSNLDSYERLQQADVIRNAVIVATFVYHTANRDARLPRKAMPKPKTGSSVTFEIP